MLAQALDAVFAKVSAVDQHLAISHVVEARQQPGHGRLAAAGSPDQSHRFARPQMEVEPLEHGLGAGVAERDVPELDVAPRLLPVDGSRPVRNLGLLVQKLEDAHRRGRRTLGHDQDEGQEAEGSLQAHDVRVEEQQDRDRDRAADREPAAVDQDHRSTDARQALEHRGQPRADVDLQDVDAPQPLGRSRQERDLIRLAGEGLHHAGTGDVLLHDRRQVGHARLNQPRDREQVRAHARAHEVDARQRQHRKQGQCQVNVDHQAERDEEREHRHAQVGHHAQEHERRTDVGVRPGDQLARLSLVVEREA